MRTKWWLEDCVNAVKCTIKQLLQNITQCATTKCSTGSHRGEWVNLTTLHTVHLPPRQQSEDQRETARTIDMRTDDQTRPWWPATMTVSLDCLSSVALCTAQQTQSHRYSISFIHTMCTDGHSKLWLLDIIQRVQDSGNANINATWYTDKCMWSKCHESGSTSTEIFCFVLLSHNHF